jgi:hypothetical protein
MACARPRYVFCRKLKENLSFWHIATKVPVVFSPCIVLLEIENLLYIKLETHIGKQKEREKIDKCIRQRLVLFKRCPYLDKIVSSRGSDFFVEWTNLFPTDSKERFAFRKGRARTMLLKYN